MLRKMCAGIMPAAERQTRVIGLSVALCLVPVAAAVEWDIEVVDDAMNGLGAAVDLTVDSSGRPHIANGMHPSRTMRYLTTFAGKWTAETVDAYPSGLGAAIALDDAGQPCLVYRKNKTLVFARRGGDNWVCEPVDDADTDRYALATSSAGVPHVLYISLGDPWNLRHAWKSAGDWLTEVADPTVNAGRDLGAAFDRQDRLHVSHWAAPNYGSGPFQEKYSLLEGGKWSSAVVDWDVEDLNMISSGMAVDGDDLPRMAYMTHRYYGSSRVKYAEFDGTQWQISTVVEGLLNSAGCRLVVDRMDAPHIVYGTHYSFQGGESQLRYAHRAGGQWLTEPIDTNGDAGELNALALDQAGHLHVAYFATNTSGPDGELRYARSRTPVVFSVGDVNCDGLVDFGDINPFVLALTDPAGYQQAFPECDILKADINGDEKVDFADINPFVGLLTGVGASGTQ